MTKDADENCTPASDAVPTSLRANPADNAKPFLGQPGTLNSVLTVKNGLCISHREPDGRRF